MRGKDHVAGVICDDDIRARGHIVEELFYFCQCVGRWGRLMHGEGASAMVIVLSLHLA